MYGAIEFIEKTKVQPFHEVEIGRRVACIGAGNTAIDVVTAARRLGAETVYLDLSPRRTGNARLCLRISARQAGRRRFSLADAARARAWRQTASLPASNACERSSVRQMRKAAELPSPVPGTEFTLDVDMVVRAVGQKPATEFPEAQSRAWRSTPMARCKINERTKLATRNILPAAIARTAEKKWWMPSPKAWPRRAASTLGSGRSAARQHEEVNRWLI